MSVAPLTPRAALPHLHLLGLGFGGVDVLEDGFEEGDVFGLGGGDLLFELVA